MNRVMLYLILGICPCLFGFQPSQAQFVPGLGTKGVVQDGIVEKVYQFDEDGFTFLAYQVKYKGIDIIVTDVIALTNLKVGEKITFMVMKNDLTTLNRGAKKVLTFNIVRPPA